MTKQIIIYSRVNAIHQLPSDKAIEISDFANFILKKYEDQLLTFDIQKMVSKSDSFSFLENEEDLYTINYINSTLSDYKLNKILHKTLCL
jgi:hypothetical protein